MEYMTPFEKHQLMLDKQRESEANSRPSKSRRLPWAHEMPKYYPTAATPSPLLEEYMRKQAEKKNTANDTN